mgnify:CR=1 FL=1
MNNDAHYTARFILPEGVLRRLRELSALHKCGNADMIARALLAYDVPVPEVPDVIPGPRIEGFPISNTIMDILQSRADFNARQEQTNVR